MNTLVEYIWIGGNKELRSKTRVYKNRINCISQVSDWNFDGSSTEQASGEDSEVILKPRALFVIHLEVTITEWFYVLLIIQMVHQLK